MRSSRGTRLLLAVAAAAAAAAVAAGAAVLGRGDGAPEAVEAADAGPVHVHGLGIDPADGALFIATHTGLFRAGPAERKARRVGKSLQDTMGFTIVGPNRFFGSGHPDMSEALERDLPPLLGLIESTDAGRTWRPVSLLGEADFHVLRIAGDRVYGYDASGERLLASDDEGRTWRELPAPGQVIDLVARADAPERLVAAAAAADEAGMYASADGGRTWRRIAAAVGYLAWPAPDALYLVDGSGAVGVSGDGGRTFERRGEIGGEPAAFLAHESDLYAALHDGTVKRSADGGRTWTVRAEP